MGWERPTGLYIYGDDLVNSISLNYTIKEIGATGSVLYTSKTNPVRVDAKTVRKITGRYLAADSSTKRIGGYQFQPINAPPAYYVRKDQAGLIVVSSNYTVYAEGNGSSVNITIDNQNTFPIYVFNLVFKGTPLTWYEETVSYTDPHGVRKYDPRHKQPLNIKMLNSLTFVANLNATLAGHMLNRTIGDRITVTSTYINHNADYVIIGEGHQVDTVQRTHKVTWYLKPLSREVVWVLDRVGRAELGVNTYLGL